MHGRVKLTISLIFQATAPFSSAETFAAGRTILQQIYNQVSALPRADQTSSYVPKTIHLLAESQDGYMQ
jgi:hypothetical protein